MKKHLLFIFAVCTLLSACKVEIDSSRDNQDPPPIEKILLVNYQTDYGVIPDSLKDGIEVKENTVLTEEQLPVLTADDVVFKGWYDGTTLAVAGEYKVTKSVTLKAYWNTMSTVTLKTDSETVSSIIKCTGEAIDESEIPVLSKTGYTFNGWFAEEIQLTAGYIVTKDITFIPKWTANEYTITFNSNNTEAQTSTQKVTYDTTVKLADCAFTYDGYRFAGWNVAADGKGASYSDGSDFAVTITEDITLYAQWAESDRYIIKYENTNGVDNTNPVSYRKTEGATLTDLIPPIGYIFEGWYDSADSNGNGSGNKVENWGVNQKTGDLTLYAKWSPRTDIVYKVEHWQQNITDDGYSRIATDNLTGTTATQTNAVAKVYTGFTAKSFEQTTIAANGSSVVKIYYDRNIITYTFNANGGNWSGDTSNKTVSGKFGATVTAPENPVLTGYTFSEWSAEIPAIFGTENLTFTASYTASNATAYKVEHWQQNIADDGYTRIATDNLTGTTATQTTAAARTYTGFTSKSFEQTTIAANGSTVVRIEYDRNLITYTFNANGGNWSGDTSNKTVSGKFGALVTAPASPAKTGYTFGSWNATVPETFGSANVTFTAQWVEGTGTAYKVEHYQQNADDNEYTLKDTENLVGTTAAQTAAAAKTYDNFTAGAVTQASIAADGSTIVKIYYTRNNVTLTLNLDGGSLGTQTDTATITGKYGSSYTIETPVKTGYTFANWSSTLPAKLEAGTYTAIYTANTNTAYTVEHYQQNIDDDEYTCTETDNLTGTTATTTSAAAKTYTGFTANSVSQTTIAADGTSVVKIYYDRNTITYTFDAEGGNWSGSTANQTVSGKFGAAVTAPAAPTKMGYTFKEWSGTSSVPATFGASNLTFTATYTANTNTLYKVEHYQQNIVDDGYAPLSAETETKFGTTGSQTNALSKSYIGFSAQPVTQNTINADGTTVIIVYYNRATATYIFNANGGNWDGITTDQTVSGKFGATVTAPAAPTKTGYTFSAWSGTVSVPETFGTESLTFTANYTANTNTPYKVEHYQQNANDDEYTRVETDDLTGTTATQTAATAKTYDHFTAGTISQSEIAADGSTVVQIYYTRETVTFTLELDGGTLGGQTGTIEQTGKYGQTVGTIANPTRQNYCFEGWNNVGGAIAQTFTANTTYTAKWSAAGGISVTVGEGNIVVTKTVAGNIITFTAEECDSYSWTLDDDEIGTEQTCVIDTSTLNKGTYTIALESQKNEKWYSYFAQIKVLYDKALIATSSTIANVIQNMTQSGLIVVTGELSAEGISSIRSSIRELNNSKPSVFVMLDLSQVIGLTNFNFENCKGLKSIVIPDSVNRINVGAFHWCSDLTSINISNSVLSIEDFAFEECRELKNIVIPNSVSYIGYAAFSGCTELTSVTIPDSVTRIGQYAFEGCTALTNVTFETTSGWKAGNIDIDPINLSNPTTAATYLKIYGDDWTRTE